MSQADEVSENHLEFENLLQRAKELVLAELAKIEKPDSLSGSEFEKLVFEQVKKAVSSEKDVKQTPNRAFPDIIVDGTLGIEVKATQKNDWRSVGNSVLESSREPDLEFIYVFFGKLGGEPDIKYRNYENCLREIKVTHYPRYQIDMNLADGESIFEKMGTSYEEISNSSNPIKTIRSYYKESLQEGEGLWWIDDDIDATATTDPIIKKLSRLSGDKQDKIKADLFVHFPEIFSSSTKKFERLPAYLAAAHSVLSPNLRDFFTAGGQVEIQFERQAFKIPQMLSEAMRLRDEIEMVLSGKTQAELAEDWDKSIPDFSNSQSAWLTEVDAQTQDLHLPVPFSKIFASKAS